MLLTVARWRPGIFSRSAPPGSFCLSYARCAAQRRIKSMTISRCKAPQTRCLTGDFRPTKPKVHGNITCHDAFALILARLLPAQNRGPSGETKWHKLQACPSGLKTSAQLRDSMMRLLHVPMRRRSTELCRGVENAPQRLLADWEDSDVWQMKTSFLCGSLEPDGWGGRLHPPSGR